MTEVYKYLGFLAFWLLYWVAYYVVQDGYQSKRLFSCSKDGRCQAMLHLYGQYILGLIPTMAERDWDVHWFLFYV
jgi:hypothetical protein